MAQLAREVRRALRKKDIKDDFPCVYSDEILPQYKEENNCGTEQCLCPKTDSGPGDPELASHEWCSQKAQINGSVVHITAIFGFILASLAIDTIIQE